MIICTCIQSIQIIENSFLFKHKKIYNCNCGLCGTYGNM